MVTDHYSLQRLREVKTGKLSRWAAQLGDYDMEVRYKKRKDIVVVDYLSRHLKEQEDFIAPRLCIIIIDIDLLAAGDLKAYFWHIENKSAHLTPLKDGTFYRSIEYTKDGFVTQWEQVNDEQAVDKVILKMALRVKRIEDLLYIPQECKVAPGLF